MKNLTKAIATVSFAVASLFASSTVKAQSATPANAWRFGIGIEGMATTGGQIHDISNAGIGGTARLQYGISNNLAFTLTSGYYNFFGKDYSIVQTPTTTVTYKAIDFGIVPVKAGLKAYVGEGFYVSGEVGAGFETKDAYRGRTGDLNEKATKLILAPGLGYSWSNVDLGVRYENFSGNNNNYGMVAARLAYGFKL